MLTTVRKPGSFTIHAVAYATRTFCDMPTRLLTITVLPSQRQDFRSCPDCVRGLKEAGTEETF